MGESVQHEKLSDDSLDEQCADHGEVTAMFIGTGPPVFVEADGTEIASEHSYQRHIVKAHDDGTVYAQRDGRGRRGPARFDRTTDGKALRTRSRGERGDEARTSFGHLVPGIVEADQPGSRVSDADHDRMLNEMEQAVSRGESPLNAAIQVSFQGWCRWSDGTVLDHWYKSRERPRQA